MSIYDSPADVPNQIKTEGEQIAVSWKPGVPTASTPGVPNSAEGTISWNIPTPARGCTTIADANSAYCGIIVAVSTTPFTAANRPVDGQFYAYPDPTVDPDKHTGDKLGNALVVGAFYEGETKARGEDLTTSMVVSDVDAETPYYVRVYAVDCQFRYHRDGIGAQSAPLRSAGTPDTDSNQTVELGSGVALSDSTGLSVGSPEPTYEFDLLVTDTYPDAKESQIIHIEVNGADVATYDDLVTEIRKNIAQYTIDNSAYGGAMTGPGSPCNPPGTGAYCLQSGVIKQFDGTQFNAVEGVLYETSDPSVVAVGSYWYAPTSDVLSIRVSGSPSWVEVNVTPSVEDPAVLISCDNYWFNGTKAYQWCGTTWCEQELYNASTDPSMASDLGCCAFWYDETNEQLFQWNESTSSWQQVFAIYWDVEPTNLITGTYWFDTTNNALFQRDPPSPAVWREIPNVSGSPVPAGQRVIVSEDEPTAPGDQLHWYNPTTEELKIYYASGSPLGWVDTPVLVWPNDPTDVESCDLWWNSVNDNLYKWDSVNSEWDQVQTFVKDAEDPYTPPTINEGALWYNPTDATLKRWNGSAWEDVEFVNNTVDPALPAAGAVWHKTDTDKWFVWQVSPGMWVEIDPFETDQDPAALAVGTLWFNPLTPALYERNSGSPYWTLVSYEDGCTLPYRGYLWYNQCNETLYRWSGAKWVDASDMIPVTVRIDGEGNLTFTTTTTGSKSVVLIIVPDGILTEVAGTSGYSCLPVVYSEISQHSFGFYGPEPCGLSPDRLRAITKANGVTKNNFLFRAISIAKILPQNHGFDGVSDIPSYLEDGVGTDGTSDERRYLIDAIRQQLGYPSVKVELTNQQLDTAIRKALDTFRMRSSLGYKRGFYFLDVIPGLQNYKLTSKQNGYNKIVTVMGAYRFTSAFLSSAHGAGVYGQVVLQHLYNMGTFDLTSFHLISQYIEQLEHLFATRLTYHWDEPTRVFSLYASFVRNERILLETTYERTEQELMTDRWCKNWIERWAISEALLILARIRGKYSTLPGAGGGVSLDAADLVTRAEGEQERLLDDLFENIGQDTEDYGQGTAFIIG